MGTRDGAGRFVFNRQSSDTQRNHCTRQLPARLFLLGDMVVITNMVNDLVNLSLLKAADAIPDTGKTT